MLPRRPQQHSAETRRRLGDAAFDEAAVDAHAEAVVRTFFPQLATDDAGIDLGAQRNEVAPA